jgi:hypothetical protein
MQAQAEAEGDTARAEEMGVPQLNVSYKPQKISPKFAGTVRELLHKRIREAYVHPQFIADVMRPLNMESIIDQEVMQFASRSCSLVRCLLTGAKSVWRRASKSCHHVVLRKGQQRTKHRHQFACKILLLMIIRHADSPLTSISLTNQALTWTQSSALLHPR